jgi:hypothetical protein
MLLVAQLSYAILAVKRFPYEILCFVSLKRFPEFSCFFDPLRDFPVSFPYEIFFCVLCAA